MKTILRHLAAAALGLTVAATAALPALAAPSNPRVVGTATQASGVEQHVVFATTGAISAGDAVMIIAASELNMPPLGVSCADCFVSRGGATVEPHLWSNFFQPTGKAAQAELRTFVAYAGKDLPIGTQLVVRFAGRGGAKSVTVVAISDAADIGLNPTGAANYASGSGTAIGWGCTTPCTIAANLMMVNASMIPSGGSDTYTEDAGWTFLHQTAAGAWPAIRIAYKPSGAGGTFSYGLTNGTSRSWISGAVLVK